MLVRATGNVVSSPFFYYPSPRRVFLNVRKGSSSVQSSQSGRCRAAISPSPAVRSAASAAARGLPGVRSRPGTGGEEEGGRAQPAAAAAAAVASPPLPQRRAAPGGHGLGAARCLPRARGIASAARACWRQR